MAFPFRPLVRVEAAIGEVWDSFALFAQTVGRDPGGRVRALDFARVVDVAVLVEAPFQEAKLRAPRVGEGTFAGDVRLRERAGT